ncbi:hypothetical protein C8R44DRAFT_241955 [Mycena epipterygia]|nr:hypothetical protein C8R44DRAFT_241955 [Mycena epipterygia]
MRSKDDLHTPEAQEISAAQTIPTANVDTHFSKSPSPKRRRTLPNPIGAGAIFSADSTSTADTFDGQRTPLQQLSPPAPPSFYSVPSNMQQCDPRLRRASLDAQAFQRPYPTRDWLPPRAPDGYQPTQSPSFTVPATIQPKPEPDFSQWALLRPAHPSPEATHPHAVGGQYDQPELFTRRLPVPSPDKDRYTAAASPMYSWTPASGLGRDIFSSSSATPENPQPQLSQTPTPVFWGMSSNSVPRAQFEQQQQASTPQSGWANAADRYVYDGQTHYSMTR